ncbi:MAG TPA: DNA repair protein RecO [Rhabdochlamydiaceae bacterium]|jgi:DNA repair protein RecO (recombination protein O)
MHDEKTEGIVLRSLDYKDSQRIITVFTPLGLLSLIVKGLHARNTQLLTLTTPFCEGEFLFKRGRSELLKLVDGTVLDPHLSLRQRLSSLETASHLNKAILASQLAGKISWDLYQLFRIFLKQIPSFELPAALLASFQLKLLTHEGLLFLSQQCNRCPEKSAQFLSKGESLCQAHSLEEGFSFSPEEWICLIQLQQAREFSALRALDLPLPLLQKISLLFHYRLLN